MDDNERNVKRLILEAAKGEEIEAVVMAEARFVPVPTMCGKVLQWYQVAPRLDFQHANGCSEQRPILTAWTKNWVIIMCEYDSQFWYESVPRNPVEHKPHTYGG